MLSRKREWQRLWGSDNQGYLSNKRSHQVWHSEGEHSGAREGKRGLVIPMGPISWSSEIQWEKFSQENSMIWFVFWVTFLAAVWRMGFKMARVEAVRRWSQQRKKPDGGKWANSGCVLEIHGAGLVAGWDVTERNRGVKDDTYVLSWAPRCHYWIGKGGNKHRFAAVLLGWKPREFSLGHIMFEMPTRYSSGYIR